MRGFGGVTPPIISIPGLTQSRSGSVSSESMLIACKTSCISAGILVYSSKTYSEFIS